jgi:hypothetical protein
MSFTVNEISKDKVPAKLAVPNNLHEKKRQEVIAHLNSLVADVFALYVKSKNFIGIFLEAIFVIITFCLTSKRPKFSL